MSGKLGVFHFCCQFKLGQIREKKDLCSNLKFFLIMFHSNRSSLPKKGIELNNLATPNFNIKLIQRKFPLRQPTMMSGVTAKRVGLEIRQRVLSARQHRQKNVQNQLNVALKMNAVKYSNFLLSLITVSRIYQQPFSHHFLGINK